MATCYATTTDVADFLRITISACTSPSIAQVEKLIKRAEDRVDRRTGHAWRTKTSTEIFDLPLMYTFGWGTMLTLKHRNIKVCACSCTALDTCAGDMIELWKGSTSQWECTAASQQNYEVEYIKGEIYLRGLIFTILRRNRIRVTYRYGETTVPDDIEDAVVKLTCIDLLRSSIKMDDLEFGGSINKEQAMEKWQEDVDKLIRDREEVYVLP
mgnify:CR=1|jgi:hypothetical protein